MSGEHDPHVDFEFDTDEPEEPPVAAVADEDEDDLELLGQFFDGLGS